MEFCNTNNICRLCLKSCHDVRVLDETIISDLHSILLYLDFAITEEPTVCQQCLENIKNCINFKAKCVLNENVTTPLVSNGNDSKSNLKYDSSNCNSCCFCLEEVACGSSVSLENDEVEMLRKYFLGCYDTRQLVTCMPCIKYMRCHFDFIANCLQIEENISDYCDIEGTNNKGQVDLNNIINFISRNKDELRNSPDTIKVEEMDMVDVDLDIKCEVKAEDDDTKQEEDFNIENVIESKIDSSASVRFLETHVANHESSAGNGAFDTGSKTAIEKCPECGFLTQHYSSLWRHMMLHKPSMMNSIQNLLKTPFSSLSLEEKMLIKTLGRPTPQMNLKKAVKGKNKQFVRTFNNDLFKKHLWLSGCDVLNAVFCFPCVLFGGETPWTKTGVTDLNHINEKIKKHANSAGHMNNVLNLTMLGTANIATMLESAHQRAVAAHNEAVSKNRYILNVIINCIRFCGKFELALRGHDESETSSNPGIFRGLIDFSAELDEAMKYHLQNAAAFKGTSNTIQNQLLQCMLEVCHDEITIEIKKSTFVAIIVDETTDVSTIFQLTLIYRYMVGGAPVERFWSFLKPVGHDAESLAECLKSELDYHVKNDPHKLIAQTYDGAAVMSGSSNGVQARIKMSYPTAQYVHCYAHQLNSIMANAASANRNVRVFFATLGGFCSFFSNSAQCTAVLDEVVGTRLLRSAPTRWNFNSNSRIVNTVFENKEEFLECVELIEMKKSHIQHPPTIDKASGLKRTLRDNDFLFWLGNFHKIMPHVDILYNQLQKRETDPVYVKTSIDGFIREISAIQNSTETATSTEDEPNKIQPIKRKRVDTSTEDKNRELKEVCDIIICQAKERFNFTGHLVACNLFLPEKFSKYVKKFPENYLRQTVESYPFLDINKLRTELALIYSRIEFRHLSGALSLNTFINSNNLESTFEESAKLLKIIITVPVSSAEAERCFSTLKRIKTFLRNTMCQEGLSALAMLSIEKDFITNIENFNNKVIEKFAQCKNHRIELIYKEN